MRETNVIDFPMSAYDDGAEMAKRVANAMAGSGRYNPLEHCQDSGAATLAANLLLFAVIVDLGMAYKVPTSEAARRLALEVSTVTTRS